MGSIVSTLPMGVSATSDNSGVVGITTPGSNLVRIKNTVYNNRDIFPLVNVTSAIYWTDVNYGTVTGASITTDTSVLFDGHPTTRIDIPAGAPSGTIRIGTLTATSYVPTNWDGSNSLVALMSSNLSGISGVTRYVGDSAFTNFYSQGDSLANHPEWMAQTNTWLFFRADTSAQHTTRGGGAAMPPTWAANGSPTFSDASNNPRRIRLSFSYTSQTGAMSIWIGAYGIVGVRRPKLVLTLDDGYASWYDFVVPLCKYYNIPVSLGVVRNLIDTANYLTTAQLKELISDTSGLIEIVPHSTDHVTYIQGNAASLASYISSINGCRSWLQSLGCGSSSYHHPIVQSVSDASLINAMKANGWLSARMGSGGSSFFSEADQEIAHGSLLPFVYYGGSILDSTHDTTASAVMTKVNNTITLKETIFIEGHDFGAALGNNPPTWPKSEFLSLLQQIAAARDSGTIDLYKWSDWYTSVATI